MSVMMRVGLTILLGLPMFLLIATMWRARPDLSRAYDVAYAEAVFGGVVHYTDILTSHRDIYLGGPAPTHCSFAVVRLGPDPVPQPPAPIFTRPDSAQFGGLWQVSPGITSLTARPSPLDYCMAVMVPRLTGQIRAALTLPDSWLARDPLGRTWHIYAPGAHLAGRVSVTK
jgi:hypothetical protein